MAGFLDPALLHTFNKMLSNEQGKTDLSKINTHIYQCYQHRYIKKQNTSEDSICDFLNDVTDPLLTTEQLLSFKRNLTKKEIYNSLISLEKNKPLGNDGLKK